MSEDARGPDEKQEPEPTAEELARGKAKIIVDEDWKAEVQRDKEKLEEKIKERAERRKSREMPPADFLHFVSGMATQVLMQLGELENPIEGQTKVDLAAARYSIDILQILEEKTKGNLTRDEERYLKAALHDLRMRFVGAAPGGEKKEGAPD